MTLKCWMLNEQLSWACANVRNIGTTTKHFTNKIFWWRRLGWGIKSGKRERQWQQWNDTERKRDHAQPGELNKFQSIPEKSTDPQSMPKLFFFNLSIQNFTLYTSFLIIYSYILFFHPVFDTMVWNHFTHTLVVAVASAADAVVVVVFWYSLSRAVYSTVFRLISFTITTFAFFFLLFSVNNFI